MFSLRLADTLFTLLNTCYKICHIGQFMFKNGLGFGYTVGDVGSKLILKTEFKMYCLIKFRLLV